MHVNFSHVKSDNSAIETEYLLFKTKFLQGLHWQLTVGITYPSESYNLSRKLLSTGRSSPSSHFGDGILCFIAQTKDKGNQSYMHLHVAKPMKFCTVPCKEGTFLFRSG